jgi:hypothetical protein
MSHRRQKGPCLLRSCLALWAALALGCAGQAERERARRTEASIERYESLAVGTAAASPAVAALAEREERIATAARPGLQTAGRVDRPMAEVVVSFDGDAVAVGPTGRSHLRQLADRLAIGDLDYRLDIAAGASRPAAVARARITAVERYLRVEGGLAAARMITRILPESGATVRVLVVVERGERRRSPELD